MNTDENYDDSHIAFLEALWGEGYLSPGGPEEVARLLDGLDLTGRTVVDIGSGAGGITIALARDYGAGRVIGLDVEASVCAHARRKVAQADLSDRVEIRQIEPGPLPLEDGSVDMVFSKDAIVHIPDKESLARDAYRVLKPGGLFAASDWLISHDGTPSPEMADYIAKEDLDFGMASPDRYQKALEDAGFVDVRLTNRNPWYRDVAQQELERLSGPDRPLFAEAIGESELDGMIETWRAMLIVLRSGEHCPHHFRATKPG
ncbi:MAG: methyltransferase domain-containing protein [Alphaproteobacteria bacterium]|nr:methyltransferase domain-containing protein [Alphaproteobacteria bacterium]